MSDPIDGLTEWLSKPPEAIFDVEEFLTLFNDYADDSDDDSGSISKARNRKMLTERARRIARDRSAGLISELTQEKKATVRRLINRAMKNGWSRKQLASRIAAHVGLTARQQIAMENYRLALIDQGKTPQEARRLFWIKVHTERAKRARFIAENEIFAVRQQAKRERWSEKVEQKKLSPKWKRTWVTAADERTCAICSPMNGVSTTIGGIYYLKGGVPTPGPPVHPRCRCTEKLILKDLTK